jgi:hypothetical protein
VVAHAGYIEAETLAVECVALGDATDGDVVDLNGHPCRIRMLPQPLAGKG